MTKHQFILMHISNYCVKLLGRSAPPILIMHAIKEAEQIWEALPELLKQQSTT